MSTFKIFFLLSSCVYYFLTSCIPQFNSFPFVLFISESIEYNDISLENNIGVSSIWSILVVDSFLSSLLLQFSFLC